MINYGGQIILMIVYLESSLVLLLEGASMRKNEFKQLWFGSLKRSPIGTIWAAVSQNGLAVAEIGGDEFTFVKTLTSLYRVPVKRDQDKMTSALKQIEAYLKGRQQDFDIPLDWSGMEYLGNLRTG